MTGLFTINNITNRQTKLISGLSNFVNLPSLKNVYSNDWWEHEGKEYDLTAPALNGYTVDLQFLSMSLADQRALIIDIKQNGGTRRFHIRDIVRTYNMRFMSMTDNKIQDDMYLYTLRFAIDNPYQDDYTYTAPVRPEGVANSYLSMDGVNFADYGIYTLAGTKADTLQEFSAKEWLMQDDLLMNGYTALNAPEARQERTQSIDMLMVNSTLSDFWVNRDALLHNLAKPNARNLTCANMSAEAIYKDCKTSKLLLKDNGEVAWKFSLTFNVQPAYISPVS